MAAQDMTDALRHPHPDVPFVTTGDDTLTALAALSEMFTKKITQPKANNVPPSPQKTVSNKRQGSELQPVITLSIEHYHKPRTETNANQKNENKQKTPRQITPATSRAYRQDPTNYLCETYPKIFGSWRRELFNCIW
jgi:hypothetical protein